MSTDEDIDLINQHFSDPANAATSTTSSPTDQDIDLINQHFANGETQNQSAPSTLDKIGAGIEHGTLSVPKYLGHEGADFIAKQLGAAPAAISANDAKYAAEQEAYKKRYGDSTIAATAAIPGQVISTLPYMMVGGAGAEAAAPESLSAMLSKVANTNKLTRLGASAATGAAQGAEFNTLTGEDPRKGAETGALFGGIIGPGGAAALNYAKNKIGNFIEPLTEAGRTGIANKIIQGYGESPLNINASELIPGSKPTLAEATGNPGIAQLQDTLRDNNSKQFTERELANTQARNNALMGASGTPQDIEAASALRAAEAEKALGNPGKGIPSTLFAAAKPVVTDSVNSKIEQILAGKSGSRPAVVQSMNAVKDMLNDEKGNPITDPETLYHSVRKGIGDLLDKKNLTNPAGQQAAAQLGEVRDALDETIEQGAPGFKKYLSDYSQASSPIEAMKWMQGLNLKDSQGNITLSGVQNALKNANKLQNTPGISPAKGLTQNQIDTLQSIRDDLLRKQNLSLGKSYGSPTIQKATAQNKLNNVLNNSNYHLFSSKVPLEATLAGAGATVAHHIGLPADMGALAGAGVAAAGKKVLSSKNDLIREKIQNIMLNPQTYVPAPINNAIGSNLLDNPLLHYGLVPIGSATVNSF